MKKFESLEFIKLNKKQNIALREDFIKTKIKGLLDEISSSEVQQNVYDFFINDVLFYINEVLKLIPIISQQKSYSLELEKKLGCLSTQVLLKGHSLEKSISDKKIIEKVKHNYRQLVGDLIYKSIIMKRAFEKPRGYPGDYKMLEIIYDNKPISKGFGEYFDNYFLKSDYAVAVRIRKDRLREMLQSFINETKLNKINILNIACGSCREIKELLSNLKTKTFITFYCLDWDDEALKFSRETLFHSRVKNVEFEFIKEDVMNTIRGETAVQSREKQNLIYSIGLIDYLPDIALKKLISALYNFLEKNGKLILTHKDKEKEFAPVPPDWACDWKFVSRNKEEVVKLFYNSGISEFSLSIDSDDFEHIYYFMLTKR